MSHFYDMLLTSQHKRSRPCPTRTRISAHNMRNDTALTGISGTVNLHLSERKEERSSSEKSGMISRRVYPAFFVASRTQPL